MEASPQRAILTLMPQLAPPPFWKPNPSLQSESHSPTTKVLKKKMLQNRHESVRLGIVGSLKRPSKPENRMILKIHIPSYSFVESLQSPTIEFRVKNKEAQLSLHSLVRRSPVEIENLVFGCISSREMELSEDYASVIALRPNLKMTHIFDNCIVENYGKGFAS